jgi:hypothetical protein
MLPTNKIELSTDLIDIERNDKLHNFSSRDEAD